MASEQTFIMIKPDGVSRNLVNEVVRRFEQRGYKLVAMKFMQASESLIKDHYKALADKPFYAGLIKHGCSGPVVPMVWEGKNVVKQARAMLGETDPAKSPPGSIRGDYAVDITRNIIHGSDSLESAKKEINLWFKSEELVKWTHPLNHSINE